MICPYCKTENRDDRAACYHCSGDLAPLRAIVNKAKNLHNDALEHAERGRAAEAISTLQTALQLDGSYVAAWVVLGTILAREGRFEEARAAWEKALSIDPRYEKCHQYLEKLDRVRETLPAVSRMKSALVWLSASVVALAAALVWLGIPSAPAERIGKAAGGGGLAAISLLALPIVAAIAARLFADLPSIAQKISARFRDGG